MRFRLVFKGRIGGQNTKEAEKHRIRTYFHDQLESLWHRRPLSEYLEYRVRNGDRLPSGMITKLGFLHESGGLTFCPLVNNRWHLLASVDILLFSQEHHRKVFLIIRDTQPASG